MAYTKSQIEELARKTAEALLAAGVRPDFTTMRQEDRPAWMVLKGKSHFYKSGQMYVSREWKDFHTIDGGVVLGQDGVLYGYTYRSIKSDENERGTVDMWIHEISAQELVGDGVPFEAVGLALERLLAVNS